MDLIEDARAIPKALAREIVKDGSLSARKLASSVQDEDRLDFARAVVFGVVSAYWKELQAVSGRDWSLCELPTDIGVSSVPAEAEDQTESIGRAAARLDVLDASYMIGVLYIGMMPARFRAQLGAYYTPPALCGRLLDMATEAGVDWRSARVLDPACGGGAFLAPVARRMAENHQEKCPKIALKNIQCRLKGFERDPFTEAQDALVNQISMLPYRLADYGYTVSTGPLVWNRHKSSLRNQPGKGRYPLVWAESVRSEGVFEFRAEKRNHKPYFEPKADENWVVTDFPCVLLQRTTAKEQFRRLIAADLPTAFIKEHGAVVIENHLNMIKPLNGAPRVAPAALAVLLNSNVVDQVFRCINGSVAVSAYELGALPLPPPEDMKEIEWLMKKRATHETLERAVERPYINGAG